jgi:porphobilinogen synthase
MGVFPATRLRRLRQADWSRRLARETALSPNDLVWSVIISDSADPTEPVAAMPGVERLSLDALAKAAKEAAALCIPALTLFPHIDPAKKDEAGSEALNPDGFVPEAIKRIKDAAPEIGVICDVALDPFTSHGHDGVMDATGRILNDETVDRLVAQALVQAEAGCDVIAPSDMMDGRIGAIRDTLEAEGHQDVMILSYAAKYASGFYGPYREAIGSAHLQGDKKTYQMDYGNVAEAIREVEMDIAEGADMVMVKPGLPYLDIVRVLSERFPLPVLAFQVSGEYAMIQAAAANGWIDGDRVMLESLAAFKRAGASGVLTYFARRAAKVLGG